MRTAAMLALTLLPFAPLPTLAQQPAPGSVESEKVREKFWLAHQTPSAMMKLLFVRTKDQNGRLRFSERLAPPGVTGFGTSSIDNCLILEGTRPAMEALKRGLLVADVEVVRPSRYRTIVLLTQAPDPPGAERPRHEASRRRHHPDARRSGSLRRQSRMGGRGDSSRHSC
jgi:hypothetical protein